MKIKQDEAILYDVVNDTIEKLEFLLLQGKDYLRMLKEVRQLKAEELNMNDIDE